MPIPQHKDELLVAIKDTYAKLQKELEVVPVHLSYVQELEGHMKGTQMSVANLVAYLIGWGNLVLKWNAKIEKNEEVVFPDDNYNWNQLGLLAQQFYKDYENENFPELLENLEKVVSKLLHVVEQAENDVLYGTKWYKNYTMGRMIQLNTASPYKNARTRLRKWQKSRK